MTIHVLVGTGDPELAMRLRAQTAELAEIGLVGMEKESSDVIGIVAAQPNLDVVLVDEGIGPQSWQELVHDITMRQPHVATVLLCDRVDEEVLSRALEAGARGVLAREPSLEELNARLHTVSEWSRGMRRWLGAGGAGDFQGGRRGRVVAVAGAKGGTGTTTLAVQLALAAAAAKRTVCLVDMDLQCGDIPSYLDLVHRRSIVDLVGVASEITGQMLADALFVHEAGPHVLLAPLESERAEEVTSLAARQILGALRGRYEVVIVDCGSFMTEGSVTAVEMADAVALTVMPDLPCLRAARRILNLWARLQVRKGDEVSVVLTRQSRRNEIQPDFAGQILSVPLARTTIPPAFRALEKAINTGSLGRVDDDAYRRAIAQLGAELMVLPIEAAGETKGVLKRAKPEAS